MRIEIGRRDAADYNNVQTSLFEFGARRLHNLSEPVNFRHDKCSKFDWAAVHRFDALLHHPFSEFLLIHHFGNIGPNFLDDVRRRLCGRQQRTS